MSYYKSMGMHSQTTAFRYISLNDVKTGRAPARPPPALRTCTHNFPQITCTPTGLRRPHSHWRESASVSPPISPISPPLLPFLPFPPPYSLSLPPLPLAVPPPPAGACTPLSPRLLLGPTHVHFSTNSPSKKARSGLATTTALTGIAKRNAGK